MYVYVCVCVCVRVRARTCVRRIRGSPCAAGPRCGVVWGGVAGVLWYGVAWCDVVRVTATPTCRETPHVCALLLCHLGDDELEIVCLCGGGGAGQGQCMYKKHKSKLRRER